MWFEGEGVMLRVYCVVCGLRGRVIVKSILYRVADSKRSLRCEGVLLRIYCIVSRVAMVF